MSDIQIDQLDRIEVFENDFQIYTKEYIRSLNNTDDIYNSNTFTGLIKYLHKHLGINNSVYNDINTLNELWDLYVECCYKYNQKPVLEEYCILIGCSRSTLYTWMNGEYRNADICDALGSSRSDTIKKWAEECRLGRYKSAASGNVGGIFLCKAVDGMVETAPVQVDNSEHRKTIEQIAQERGLEIDSTGMNQPQIAPPKVDF